MAILAARETSPDFPLVFTGVADDPIALGFVQSFVRPGGMLTGNVMNAVGGRGDRHSKARRFPQGTCSGFDTTWHDSAQPPA